MKKTSRNIILAAMAALTLACSLLIPDINIISDMTEFLPADSPMKTGLDSLKASFPGIDTNAPTLRAMFRTPDDPDSLAAVLSHEEGIERFVSMRSNDSLTLYELVTDSAERLEETAAAIKERHEGCVAVGTNANSNMPDNMVFILAIGAALIFVILFVMCSSFMEALLFILTIGMAVLMNMGTNALLPGVSMMTNTIVAVLQFILSMDYSIILMNRFRMEKEQERDSCRAMSSALRKASSSILSSSLTTVAGLLALVFMKFRIGLDLGVVLAKGVLLSLISIYTILPALILDFEKAVGRTEKKIPLVPTGPLARFELKHRRILCLLFFVLFAAAALLQRRTELSYASVWESEISDAFPPQTSFMLLYRTEEEQKLVSLVDSLKDDSRVVSAVSYPSIMQKKLSSEEMFRTFGQLVRMLPPGDTLPVDGSLLSKSNLDILFYAISHPQRDERMSFEDLYALAGKASGMGLMPEGLDVNAMMAQFSLPETAPEEESAAAGGATAAEGPAASRDGDSSSDSISVSDSVSVKDSVAFRDSTILKEQAGASGGGGASEAAELSPSRFTYESCSAQMPYVEMSRFLGMRERDTKTLYSMAGRAGKTMSAAQFIGFVNKKVLSNPLLNGAVSKEQKAGLQAVSLQIDSVMTAGPGTVPTALAKAPDGLRAAPDSLTPAGMETAAETRAPSVVPEVREELPSTPLEVLSQMALSGSKYGLDTLYRALSAADIPIEKKTLELMYMFWGSQTHSTADIRLSIEEVVDFLGMQDMVKGSLGALRGPKWSIAAIVTNCPVESDSTFRFVEKLHSLRGGMLSGDNYLIGESVMYKEMKDGFRQELIFLTLLTIALIFAIVALAFRSALIPAVLIIAVLTGVFINVYVSGIGGGKMLYLAYLIVQSILMGATIDYGILFTNFYRDSRRSGLDRAESLQRAYKASIHTIMTSGMIMVCAPYVMSLSFSDPTISSILACLTTGAFAALAVILLLLPATLVCFDRFIKGTK